MAIVSAAGVAQGMSSIFGDGDTGGTSPTAPTTPQGGNGAASSNNSLTLPTSSKNNPENAGLIPQWGDATAMFATAQALITYSSTFIDQLGHIASSLNPPQINPNFPVAGAAPTPITIQPPALNEVTWVVPTQPNAFGTLPPDITHLLPGALQLTPPTLNFGAPPTPFNAQVPGAPSVDLNFVYPSVDVTLPNAPTLMALSTVQFNPLVIPTFSVSVPKFTIATPGIIPYVEGAGFTSLLLTDLETNLDNAIKNGALTALAKQAQDQLFAAGQEREYRAQADALDAWERDSEVLGYTLPPGVAMNSRFKIYTETQNTLAGLSRDIMYKQADLQLQNIISARGQAVELEGKLIDYANEVASRALEAAKYVTDAGVTIYNAQVQAFTASLEGYKTQALVYDTQLKGIQATIDQLNAQIAFEKTKADINTALVEQYKVQVDAALADVEIFKLQVQIIQTEAEVEKIKVDIFNAQIQAYLGQVNAYTARVEGYKAQVETQGVIESVYKTQVDAYAAEVQAGVAEANATVEGYKAQIQGYTAQLDGYKASLETMVEQARAATLFNTAEVELYKGQVEASSAFNTAVTQQWEAVLNEQEKIAEVAVKAAEANGQLYIATEKLAVDAAQVGAQVAAQLGAAALNAIHWSNSSSWGLSANINSNSSNTNATTNNTNINESA